jgi:hypothetical protein
MIQEGTEISLREERARNEHGTRAATSSQRADARTHGSRCVLAGGGNNRRDPDESGHRLPLEARGSHSRRSRPTRWQTRTPCQGASRRAALARVEVSGDLAGCKQPIAKRTARAVRSADQHQSPQRRSSKAWMEQCSQPGGKKIRQGWRPTFSREPEGCCCWQPPMRRVCSLNSRQRSPRASQQPLGLCSPVLHIAATN